jgi:hypothetical protein
VYNKFVIGPKYETAEWTKALYINWVGALVTLVVALVGDAARLERLVINWYASTGWMWEVFMGVAVCFGTIITFMLLDLIGAPVCLDASEGRVTDGACFLSSVQVPCRSPLFGLRRLSSA